MILRCSQCFYSKCASSLTFSKKMGNPNQRNIMLIIIHKFYIFKFLRKRQLKRYLETSWKLGNPTWKLLYNSHFTKNEETPLHKK